MSGIQRDIGLVLALFFVAALLVISSAFHGAAKVVWGLLFIAIVAVVLRDEPQITALMGKVNSYFQ